MISMSMNTTMGPGWSFSQLWFLALALIIVEEVGLARLMERSSPERAKTWRQRGFAYDAALCVVCLIDSSPLMPYSMDHLPAHMSIHVFEMFYVPIVLVITAPWLPALFALRLTTRRTFLRWWRFGRQRWLTMGAQRLIASPLFALVFFNAVMILWHIPRIFNYGVWHPWAHTWLMGPSFILSGYLFWRVILGSHPFGPRGSTKFQLITIVTTALIMLVIAISMAVLSHAAWYTMNATMLGQSDAFHDQQLGAAVLWICGDFWAVPAIVLLVSRIVKENGSFGAAFERSLGRESENA